MIFWKTGGMMQLRHLAWAGLEIQAGGQTVVIDLVEDFPSLRNSDSVSPGARSPLTHTP
jgi:hypothetical protein